MPHTRLSPSASSSPMASHVVSWGGDEHSVSPVLSTTLSFVSAASIPVTPERSPRTNLFIRHPKYFFLDGNVTFLVDHILYCVHRYFFCRDSIYFSNRYNQLDIRDHAALPNFISLGNVECKDFDAFLAVLYPESFEENDLSYEEWKSVLHLSTRWGFASLRRLALASIKPPTPYDRLILARTYSVDHWVVPALSALCERTAPLTLFEARQMDIEDVVLVASVREDIRSHKLRVHTDDIPRHVEAARAMIPTRGRGIDDPSTTRREAAEQASWPPDSKQTTKKEDDAHESGGEQSQEVVGKTKAQMGNQSHIMRDMRQEVRGK